MHVIWIQPTSYRFSPGFGSGVFVLGNLAISAGITDGTRNAER
jgi:hypothetical protein